MMDGETDDSGAIQDAIDACGVAGGGTVDIPAGKVLIEDVIRITYDNVVLRGAGKDRTVIQIPHSLLYYDYAAGESEGDGLQRSRGFLEIAGSVVKSRKKGSNYVGQVLSQAKAGQRSLYLDNTEGILVGDWVRLYMSDPAFGPREGSLVGMLYSSPDPAARCGESCLKSLRGWKDLVRFMSRVVSVSGNRIVLERELPFDVRTAWRPVILTVGKDTVQNSGIQDLTVQFAWHKTQKHLKEDGFNAIVLEETAFCWVRDVKVVDADLNVVVRYSNFATVSGVDVGVTKDRSHYTSPGKQGHIALGIHDSSDVDVSDFNLRGKWWHDLSVRASMLSVFRDGRGEDVNMDLHRSAPYMILYENIDLGEGTRPFATGGLPGNGLPTAGYATFWNIRKSNKEAIPEPRCSFGAKMNLVGNFKKRYKCKGRVVSTSMTGGPRTPK